ncbi:MAG: HAD family hydrolase [Erysipelotrichaceae bacterium]|nr:HAD family hydrolase [Erysipelotrichaceae bacterium]
MKAVLFDLDGTLLSMDQEEFVKRYFHLLTVKFSKEFDAKRIMHGMQQGIYAMVHNDGQFTNCEVFWEAFVDASGYQKEEVEDTFLDFYKKEFDEVKNHTSINHVANQIVQWFKDKGYMLILATNPLFPKEATLRRMQWANLKEEDFNEITTYEQYHYCKPNIKYFKEIIDKFKLNPKECIMIGNDVDEDLIIKELGVTTYIVKDHVINKHNKEVNADFYGSLKDLLMKLEHGEVEDV